MVFKAGLFRSFDVTPVILFKRGFANEKGLRAFILLFMILAVSGTLAAEKKNDSQMKTVDRYVAIFDFEVRTGDKDISRSLADSVIYEFLQSSKYEVIDRGNMNKILVEA